MKETKYILGTKNKKKCEKKMCNSCGCENDEQCSIVGYQPKYACCSKCDNWDEAHACENYQTMLAECAESKIVDLMPKKIIKKEKGREVEISLDEFP